MSKPEFNIYTLSDNHWLHTNIIKYCNRPFQSVEEQDEKMLTLWNATIRPQDMVIHLGDIIFTAGSSEKVKEVLSKLNGRKILVNGNHDKKSYNWYMTNGFDFVCDRFSWDFNRKRILFVHNPAHVSQDELLKYNFVICGHSHNNVPFVTHDGTCTFVNVSVEHLDYKPMSLIPLLNRLSQGFYEKR